MRIELWMQDLPRPGRVPVEEPASGGLVVQGLGVALYAVLFVAIVLWAFRNRVVAALAFFIAILLTFFALSTGLGRLDALAIGTGLFVLCRVADDAIGFRRALHRALPAHPGADRKGPARRRAVSEVVRSRAPRTVTAACASFALLLPNVVVWGVALPMLLPVGLLLIGGVAVSLLCSLLLVPLVAAAWSPDAEIDAADAVGTGEAARAEERRRPAEGPVSAGAVSLASERVASERVEPERSRPVSVSAGLEPGGVFFPEPAGTADGERVDQLPGDPWGEGDDGEPFFEEPHDYRPLTEEEAAAAEEAMAEEEVLAAREMSTGGSEGLSRSARRAARAARAAAMRRAAEEAAAMRRPAEQAPSAPLAADPAADAEPPESVEPGAGPNEAARMAEAARRSESFQSNEVGVPRPLPDFLGRLPEGVTPHTASIATIKRAQAPAPEPAPAAVRAEEERQRSDRATFAPLGLREDAAPQAASVPEFASETASPEGEQSAPGHGGIDLETAAAALGLPADSTAEEVLAAAEAAEQAEIEAAATGMLPVAGPADAQLPVVLDPVAAVEAGSLSRRELRRTQHPE